MKKFFTLVAIVAVTLGLSSEAHAQLGILGGLTSSKTDLSTSEDLKSISLYHAGITYKAAIGAGFAIQPSLLYQVKGANLGNLDSSTDADFQLKTGFVELPVGIQWGPELLAFRPYVFAEPFVGYRITASDRGGDDAWAKQFQGWLQESWNRFEYGFGLGGGLELAGHIQLSAQWFTNLGQLFGDDSSVSSSVSDEVRNYKGLKFSVAILF